MLSTQLESLLSPFRQLVNKNAISPQYRALELSPIHVRAVAPFGAAQVKVSLDIPETVHVDGAAFLATVGSVPNAEMEFSVKNGSLSWRCGSAKGRLGLIPDVVLPNLPGGGTPNMVTKDLIKAFELGALSAVGDRGIGNDSIRGVVLDNRHPPMVYSTDNATISVYTIGPTALTMPEMATISEQGAELLAKTMQPDGSLSVTETALIYKSAKATVAVQQIKPMEYDLRTACIDRYDYMPEQVLEIPTERIAAFARLAGTLAAKGTSSRVTLTVSEACELKLSFEEGMTQLEECYLTEDLEGFPLGDPVSLPPDKLVKALAHAKGIVIEHLHQNPVVIFCDGPFRCLVSGK